MTKLCNVCTKPFYGKSRGIQCNLCKEFFHLKCAAVAEEVFEAVQKGHVTWSCINCPNPSNESLVLEGDTNDDLNPPKQDEVAKIPRLHLTPVKHSELVDDKISKWLQQLSEAVNNIQLSLSFFNKQMEDIKLQNNQILEENRILKEKLKKSEDNSFALEKIVNTLQYEVDLPEQSKRKNNLIFAGFSTKLLNPVDAFLKITEKIHANVSKEDIKNITLIKPNSNKNENIKKNFSYLIELRTEEKKNELFAKKKNHKHLYTADVDLQECDNGEIFFRHHLTKLQTALYYEARQIKTSFEFKFLWNTNNTIFLRQKEGSKVYRIENFNDIKFIKNRFSI